MGRFRLTEHRSGYATPIATCIFVVIVLLAPLLLEGQCQPIAGSPKVESSEPRSSSTGTPEARPPEFFDEPTFTVAGVTDTTNLGGHGSNTIVRTREALAKETVSLSEPSSGSSVPTSSVTAAEDSLREAAKHGSGNFDVNHRLGKLLVNDGKANEALPYLERASELNPGDYDNAYELARAYADTGKYELARSNARTLATVQGKAGQDKAELHRFLGDVEEKLANPLEAVREYQRAAELEPSEANLFDWGAELLIHHAAEPAIEVFTKGNRLFPDSVRMLVGAGVAWYARGSYDQAAQTLCQASDLNPEDPNPYLLLGKMQSVETTQSEGLGQRLRRFVKLQPENALANYYYALSLWARRTGPEDAETVTLVESLLEKAVHLDPRLAAGYLQLGILYADRKDFSRAISAYQRTIASNPGMEEAHYRLAQVYNRTGEKAKAQKELHLYDQISKKEAEDDERERREIRQFVYTLRDRSSASRPQ